MIFLLLTIVTSTLIFIVFKLISIRNVNTFHAIVVNYTVCVIVGSLVQWNFPPLHEMIFSNWFIPAVFLGSLFISVFYVTALTVRYGSMAIASIANKLSLIVPTTLAFYLYGDEATLLKITGILIALIAVVLTSYKKDVSASAGNMKYFIYPALVLAGSGIIDAASKYCQVNYVGEGDLNFFLITLFGTSACIGLAIVTFRYFKSGTSVTRKSLVYGIMLGVPNYGSMYFLIAALAHPMWENSSTFFPVNNISIVLASAFCGLIFFREKLSTINFFGILLAIISICLITFESYW